MSGGTSGRRTIASRGDRTRTAANDPYMIIYTSGTTGKPKGAVHVHAGFPIKAAHDLAYCFDLQADDTLFWLTDLGWMMGPWAIAGGLDARRHDRHLRGHARLSRSRTGSGDWSRTTG